MIITKLSEVEKSPNPHNVDARKVFDSPHATVVIITLQPGESLKKHKTPVDVFFYVLEGTGIVEIGDEQAEVTKDSLVESPARIPPPAPAPVALGAKRVSKAMSSRRSATRPRADSKASAASAPCTASPWNTSMIPSTCLLYTSDAADDPLCVDLGGRRMLKKKKKNINSSTPSDQINQNHDI